MLVAILVLCPLLASIAALVLGRRMPGLLARLIVAGLILAAGSIVTGTIWAAVVTQESGSRWTWSSGRVVHAFTGMSLAALLASLALVLPVASLLWVRRQLSPTAMRIEPLPAALGVVMVVGSIAAGVVAAGMSAVFLLGAIDW